MIRRLAPVAVIGVVLSAGPALALPISRCVLQVDGRTYLDGPCDYEVFGDGSFSIGTWNVGEKPTDFAYVLLGSPGGDFTVSPMSTSTGSSPLPSSAAAPDHFAIAGENVPPPSLTIEKPLPTVGYWSGSPQSPRADDPLGELTRQGACWVNATARVCAYR